MQNIKIKTTLSLSELQALIQSERPEGLTEFWLGNDGLHALAETDAGSVSFVPTPEGYKLVQPAITPRLRTLAAWLQVQSAAQASAQPPTDSAEKGQTA